MIIYSSPTSLKPLTASRLKLTFAAGLACLLGGSALMAAEVAKTWEIPMGGNAYTTGSKEGGGGRGWSNPDTVQSVFFRVDRPTQLEISLAVKVPEGESKIRATVEGQSRELDLKGAEVADVPVLRIPVKQAGYVRVDLQGIRKTGPVFAEVTAVKAVPVGDGAAEVKLDYVKDNEGNRFYWGRRGPSVHMGYVLPKDKKIEWFYNEVTVPKGQDPIGSYFMSNGFGEGYFGMQVNGPDERRILFSVWSPFTTDNPKEIPEDHKIVLLKKGEGVTGGEFGGEGSGGQSRLLFPWKAGETYRFLNRARPDGKGSTIYTAWFLAPEMKEWKLIASFKRPQTDKHLTGTHSFLENFADRQGYLGRSAEYANQWACDVDGNWIELTAAGFTGDDIANRRYRLDYAGGAVGSHFFLRNGGFFAETVKPGSRFNREATPDKKPVIDLKKLDGVDAGG